MADSLIAANEENGIPSPTAPRPARFSSRAVVGRLLQGQFTDADNGASVKLQAALPETSVTVLTASEAATTWAQDATLIQMSKNLTGDHYAIALFDSRNRKFFQVVSPSELSDATRKAIADALARQEEIGKLLNAADGTVGEARLKTLAEAVAAIGPAAFSSTYPELAAELLRSDVQSLDAVRTQLRTASNIEDRKDKVNRLHFDLSMTLRALPQDVTNEKRIEAIDKFIADRKLEGEFKQLMIMRKYLVWSSSKRYPEALAALDEALAVDPNSALAGRIPVFRESVKQRMSAPPPKAEPPASQDKPASNPNPSATPPPAKQGEPAQP